LFFGLGSSYAFGIWFGLAVSLAMNYLMVSRTSELVGGSSGDNKISRRVSLLAIARYLLYGLALAVTALTEWLSFFAASGGLVLPTVALQVKTAVKNTRSGG
jgi:hypothetical protein